MNASPVTIILTTTTPGLVRADVSNGLAYVTKDSNGFIKRLDRKMAKDGIFREGYATVGGILQARAAILS